MKRGGRESGALLPGHQADADTSGSGTAANPAVPTPATCACTLYFVHPGREIFYGRDWWAKHAAEHLAKIRALEAELAATELAWAAEKSGREKAENEVHRLKAEYGIVTEHHMLDCPRCNPKRGGRESGDTRAEAEHPMSATGSVTKQRPPGDGVVVAAANPAALKEGPPQTEDDA